MSELPSSGDDEWLRICSQKPLSEICYYYFKNHQKIKDKPQLALGIIEALKHSRKEVVIKLFSLVENQYTIGREIISYALKNNQKELIISLCNFRDSYYESFKLACSMNEHELATYIFDSMVPSHDNNLFGNFAYRALEFKNFHFIKKFASLMFLRKSRLHNLQYQSAFNGNYSEKELDILATICDHFEWINGFTHACSKGLFEIVKKIMNQCDISNDLFREGFLNACNFGHLKLVHYFDKLERDIMVTKDNITKLDKDVVPEITIILLHRYFKTHPNTNLKFLHSFTPTNLVRLLNGGLSAEIVKQHRNFTKISNLRGQKLDQIFHCLQDYSCKEVLLFVVFPYVSYDFYD